jgi:hypothetical protein
VRALSDIETGRQYELLSRSVSKAHDSFTCAGSIKLKSLRCLLALAVWLCVVDSFAADKKPATAKSNRDKSSTSAFPSFNEVTKTVQQVLALDPNYQPDDLITASKVERILAKLEQNHWKVADGRQIVKQVLPDSDWMAVRLSAPDAQQFMHDIARLPGGYDRVDRLRHMPNGEIHIGDFIDTPDGSAMIEYMTTTQEGKNLGNFLSQDPDGHNFNKRTGRIYTERELLNRLKASYDDAAVGRITIDPGPPTQLTPTPPGKSKSKSKFPSKSKRPREILIEPSADEPAQLPGE